MRIERDGGPAATANGHLRCNQEPNNNNNNNNRNPCESGAWHCRVSPVWVCDYVTAEQRHVRCCLSADQERYTGGESSSPPRDELLKRGHILERTLSPSTSTQPSKRQRLVDVATDGQSDVALAPPAPPLFEPSSSTVAPAAFAAAAACRCTWPRHRRTYWMQACSRRWH